MLATPCFIRFIGGQWIDLENKPLIALQLNFGQHFDYIEKFAGLPEKDERGKKMGKTVIYSAEQV